MKCLQRPDPEDLAVCLAIPPSPNFFGLGSWVEHLTAPRDDFVSNILKECLDLPEVRRAAPAAAARAVLVKQKN